MSKPKTHIITATAGSVIFSWRCRSCHFDNVSGIPALNGHKTFVCPHCCDSLTILLTVNQFAYHYRRLA